MRQEALVPKGSVLWIAAVAALVALVEMGLSPLAEGSLLLTLLFWTALAEGAVALAAAAELSRAGWIGPLKERLLSAYPLIGFLFLVSLLLWPKLSIYPWSGNQTLWLNESFFMARGSGGLLVAFLLARKFSMEVSSQSPRKGLYAVLYLLSFVASQTLVAFDWVMSLEYPWYSTLFGGYFFIESVYAGIALSGIFCFLLTRRGNPPSPDFFRTTLRDSSTLLFGFSLLWAGLFFAQFLVIWYGNIPEEVSFIARRVTESPLRELSWAVLFSMFFIPFPVFLSLKAKTTPSVALLISSLVLFGIGLERLVFLLPVVSISPLRVALEFLLVGALFARLVRKSAPWTT
jgi:hypothetical protein